MGIKQLYNHNLRKLSNEYGDVSVMIGLLCKLLKSEKGHNSTRYLQNFYQKLIRSSVPWTQSVCQISHPSSSISPDILFTRSFMGQMPSLKRGIL